MAFGSKDRQTLLSLAYFGHRITTGLPVDAGLRLYTVSERGGYKRRIGLSPPAAYPSTMGYEANEGSL
jgi:hypothetical protein